VLKIARVTNVVPGPSTAVDEIATQRVTFRVRAVDPSKFTVQPSISPSDINPNGTGSLRFTLAPDVNSANSGPILIEITADDQGASTAPNASLSATRTVTLNVTPVNDPPSFSIVRDSIALVEDGGRATIGNFISSAILPGPGTATDETGQGTTIAVAAATPSYFSIQPRINAQNELEFQLAPDVNSLFANSLNILVTATDNGSPVASFTRTLTVTVADINDQPTFVLNTTNVIVIEDQTSPATVFPGFAANLLAGPQTAVDENGGFTPAVPGQITSFANVNVSNSTMFTELPTIDTSGTLRFTTAPDANGTSVVVVRLTDNGRVGPPPNNNLGPTATYTITVSPINDAPEFTIPATTSVVEDQGVVSLPGFATGIRPGPITARDEGNQSLSFVVRAENPAAFADQPTIQSDGTLVFRTAANVNNNTSGLSRRVFVSLRDNGVSTPAPNDNLSDEKTFLVNITPVNDPPIPTSITVEILEDTSTNILETSILPGVVAGPVDEVEVELQSVRITRVEGTSERGGIVTPVFVGDRIVSFQYQAPTNYVGIDLIRYVVTDNGTPQESATGTVSINLTPINDAPQFVPGADVTVTEDAPAYSQPWATGVLAGPPTAFDENSGPSAQIVSFAIVTDNDGLFSVLPAVNSTGVLSFTLAPDANGRAVIDITAIDNGLGAAPNVNRSSTSRFTIVATPVNDAPGFQVIGNVSVDEDSPRYQQAAIRNIVPAAGINNTPSTGRDEIGQVVTISTSNNNTALFSVQPTINGAGVLEFVPAQDAFGTAIVSVVARDNGPSTAPNVNQSPAQSFTITIRPLNDSPVAVNDRYATGEDSQLVVPAAGVLVNDRDVDLPADSLSVLASQTTSTLGANVSIAADGSFTYDSRNAAQLQRLVTGETASDTFTYTIRDSSGATSNLATVTVNVAGSNDNPNAVDDSFSIPFGISQLLNVLANDTDPDTTIDPTTVEIGELASNGTATALSTGRIEYVPNPNFRGLDTFTYRVRDRLGAVSNEARVTIDVNTRPIALADSALTAVNTSVVIDVLANDSDPDGTINRSSISIVSGPDVGTTLIQANGTIQYTPPTNFAGLATFQYAVLDNEGLSSNIASVTVQVTNSLFQNPANRLDVNADGFISPIDVLIVVNDINFNGARRIPAGFVIPPYIDVNGDQFVGPLDALELINFINSRGNAGAGEGEGSSMAGLGFFEPIEVEMMAPAAILEAKREYEEQLAADLSLSSFADRVDQGIYGPALLSEDEVETEETLESYMAQWMSQKPKRLSSTIDSAFSEDDWM
jgi:VCBS repeat-containing protein